MGASNSTALVTSEPVTGEQTVFAAALCSVHTCALQMTADRMLKSGCSMKTFAICAKAECRACICQPDSETLMLCEESRCSLVYPRAQCKHTSRAFCLGNRCALPCDNDVPCMCACVFLKCFEGHPHPFKVDLKICAAIPAAAGGAPANVEMVR
uniref:Uncharacterized protein n=1 Tax=Prymnesium polylepis TaxID=72548 RepID=A0A6V4VUI1_9EUKA|mmetsp:Transcript_8082/g.21225  ORF Transcript_8082/g.21225 Transcript_8082/m.21225 type:complete len:154 (-) Transcript_8082:252-713(-)